MPDERIERLSGLELGLHLAVQPGYLGNPEVVAGVLAPLFEAVMLRKQAHYLGGDLIAAFKRVDHETDQAARIFSGENPDYTTLPSWNTAAELGQEAIRALSLDPEYYADENIYCIMSEGLTGVVLVLGEIIDAVMAPIAAGGDGDTDALQADAFRLFAFVVAVFLGTRSVSFPGIVLDDFKPKSQHAA